MTTRIRPLLLGLGLIALAAAARGQTTPATTPATTAAPAPEPAGVPTSANAASTLHFNIEVTTKSGQPVTGLPEADFTVLDNGAAVPLRSFHEVTPAQEPVTAYVLIDAVNDGAPLVSYTRQEVSKFLSANGGKLPFPTSVALLTDTGISVEGTPTRDGAELSQGLAKQVIPLRDIGRSAGFYGANDRAGLSLKALATFDRYASTVPGRKILLWISPGWPLLSGPGVELDNRQQQQLFAEIMGLSNQMREANVTLYNVNQLGAQESPLRSNYYREFVKGVTKTSQVQFGDLGLQVLAEQSGGRTLIGSTDVAGMLKSCVEELTDWYDVEVPRAGPGERPAQFHAIEVRVNQPGLLARTRNGFYTSPE